MIDGELATLVQAVPAVSLVGPKAIGKTESARRLAASVLDLADVDERVVVQASRKEALARAKPPVLIDEWQHDPDIWEAMRRAVDADPSPGRFLLTGSANPRDVRVHSGAGRVVRLRMRPMSLAERGSAEPTVSLAGLWKQRGEVGGTSSLVLADYVTEILGSGLPAIRLGPERARTPLLKGYVESVLEHDVPELGFVPKRPASLAQWLRAYAAASSTTATYESIAGAVPDDQRATRTTIGAYRDVLEHLWLLDPVPAFALSRNRLGTLGQMPKHQLADPALVGALLDIGPDTLLDSSAGREFAGLRDGPLVGNLFESLATLCVRVYAQPLGLSVSHVRTARGEREIDLVVHAPDGRTLAIEVKLAATPDDRDVRHLHWLGERLGDDLVDKVVLTTGRQAYRRPDGVAVVPLALLGP
ncbi:ATPase AAA [Luteimicrobium album]|uniref:ATPase AAA n=1 Tax=Luteimicrobium album TaxID=1054550 RepID=A0ABQ6HXG9_9MICO|nr:ATPase AAA [Luteimicrobium album]